MNSTFCLGIDLGTTNSAIAVTDLEQDRTEIVNVTQLLGPNQIGERATLPSALYIPHPDEFPPGALRLPWQTGDEDRAIVGVFARDHGALVPDRLITSAKSWLSNPHIDARQKTLPWNSGIDEKLSAVESSRRYLEHLRAGFAYAERLQNRDWNLADGTVVLAVPASFDEVARNLTAEAAQAAGLGNVTLLEEPQAAFYAWLSQAAKGWRTQVGPGDVVLVCDLGGGTADFSLIAVTESGGELALERISVGEHILLGGDNMDLALAYTLMAQLEAAGTSIDDWQLLALVHAAAAAKIQLFNDASLTDVPIAVPSRGSSLFARTVSTSLDRATLERVVLDGFFPLSEVTDVPQQTGGAGLREFGLPYASDAAVSKHLARFLVRSLANVRASETLSRLVGARAESQTLLAPTAVLFNGGVFNADPIRKRVRDVLERWTNGGPVRELQGAQLDLAVAKGAALYGRNRATGKGARIKAGTARSYYIGLESSMPAVPGLTLPVKALCVVPQGMEEGSETLIAGREFGLVTGRPADFRFFSSETRSGDTPGQILPNAERELDESSRLEVELPAVDGFPEGQAVPVQINALVTELGTLELWMKHANSDRRWKVEFAVRTE
jgi:molecular chaperone DnaK (HSP70)